MKGFTLIELMVVVVILAVASTAVVPNFVRSLRAAQLRTSAENLTAAVRLGQIRALTQGRFYRLVLDQTTYWLEEDVQKPETVNSNEQNFQKIDGKIGRLAQLPAGVVLKDYPPQMLLSPNGRISSSELKVCRENDCVGIVAGRVLGQIELISVKDGANAVL